MSTPLPEGSVEISDRRLLRSETLRAGLLGGVFLGLLIVAASLVSAAKPSEYFAAIRSSRGIGIIFILVLYEVGVFLWLLSRRPLGKPSPIWFRYLNSTLEISAPTVAVAMIGMNLGLVPTLMGAAPWVYFLPIIFSALYLDFRLSLYTGMMAAVQFAVISLVALQSQPVVEGWPVLTSPQAVWFKVACLVFSGLAAAFVARQIRHQMESSLRFLADRNRAISIFGQHVSPQVAEMLLSQPVETSGEERNVCVMFLDIRDFSVFAAANEPAVVMDYLNTLFGELIQAVNKHGGIVNKFLGDGFMAVFGAPVGTSEPCNPAVAAGHEILRIVETMNKAGRISHTRLGIGLHSGIAVTGNVGSLARKEYTIIGDVVNLASRIEQATKQFGASFLVSEQVLEALKGKEKPIRDLGMVELKGQARPAHLYQLV